LKYLFDHNLSPKYPAALAALGVNAVALRDEFPQNIKDVDLLTALKSKDYVLISGDRAMTTNSVEVSVLRDAKVTCLFMGPFWDKLKLWDKAAWLVSKWPMLEAFATSASRGQCAECKQSGRWTVFAP